MNFSFLLRPADIGKSLTGIGPVIVILILFGIGKVIFHQFTYEGKKEQSISFFLGGNPWAFGTEKSNTFAGSRGWWAELEVKRGVGSAISSGDGVVNLIYGEGEEFDNHDRPSNRHPARPDEQFAEFDAALTKLDLQNAWWDIQNYEGLEDKHTIFFDELFRPVIDAGWIPNRFYHGLYGTNFEGYTHKSAVKNKVETLVYGLLHDDLDIHKSDRSYYDDDDTIFIFCAYSSLDDSDLSRIDIFPYRVDPNIKYQELNWDRRDQLWADHGYIHSGTNAERDNHDLFRQQLISQGWKLVSEPSVVISEYSEPNEDDELQINPRQRQIRLGLWTFQR